MIGDFLVQEIERIGRISVMARVVREITRYIDIDEVNGFLTHVHRIHRFGSSAERIQREATGIAEHIQYIFSARIAFH